MSTFFVIRRFLMRNSFRWVTTKEIQAYVNQFKKKPIKSKSIYNYMDTLVSYNLVHRFKNEETNKYKTQLNVYRINFTNIHDSNWYYLNYRITKH